MFPSAAPRGNIEILGKQNELFPSGPVIKCLMFTTSFCRSYNSNQVHCVGPTAEPNSLFFSMIVPNLGHNQLGTVEK